MDEKFIALTQEWHTKGWNARQSEIDELKAQLECCRKENAVLLGKVGDGERRISFLEMNIKYVLDHFDMNDLDKAMPRVYEDLKEALRGEHD
ncbi:hypothetical protein [Acinetobacter radioresistens]|uniref:hypothetical protein n=1 Tax=Acinetobacter radioresistens TaxID=40216 RepID=UPI002003CCF9|nr:hypothetical protein [Acinetobacter radioresistens]MCK4081338.1 hypothetical protein [Acinetobacter radioresistens]